MKVKIELTYSQLMWLYEFVGQSPASVMSVGVWEALDRQIVVFEEISGR